MLQLLVFAASIFLTAEAIQNDCSMTFKGRVIRAEYLYYKGYWMGDFSNTKIPALKDISRSKIFDHTSGVSWKLHDCGLGYVCIESLKYESFFLYSYPSISLMAISDINRDVSNALRFTIWCKDDCSKHDSCMIESLDHKKLYSEACGILNECMDCGNPNWFQWDIVLNEPMERMEPVENSVCNKAEQTIGVTFSNSQKVGVSSVVAHTHGLNIEIAAAFQADPLPWSYSFKVTQSNEWRYEGLKNEEHETRITIIGAEGLSGIQVPTNKKVVMEQLIGYYGSFGDFRIKSRYFTIKLINC